MYNIYKNVKWKLGIYYVYIVIHIYGWKIDNVKVHDKRFLCKHT